MNSIKSKGNRYIKHMTSWLFYCVLLLFMLLALVVFTVPVPSSTLTSRWWLKIDCSGSVYTAEISKRYQARPLFVCLFVDLTVKHEPGYIACPYMCKHACIF